MNVSELKIGNYYKAGIEFNGSFEATLILGKERVFKMTREKLSGILNLNMEDYILPVFVDDNWLKALGFDEYIDPLVGRSFEFYSADDELFGLMSPDYDPEEYSEYSHIWDGAFTESPCNNVNQLQDLFFALTGKELDIKIKGEVD